MPARKRHHFWLSVNRVETLADGIFAISMTLLVLGLDVPRVPREAAGEALRQTLANDWPKFEDYALSFLLLGMFWIIHHRLFHYIKRATESFLWINIIILMLVALVPFSTSVMAQYDGVQEAALIFQANLLAVGLAYYFLWWYATEDHRLVDPDEIDADAIVFSRRLSLVTPAVSLAAMALSFVTPSWSETVYLACPFLLSWMRRGHSR